MGLFGLFKGRKKTIDLNSHKNDSYRESWGYSETECRFDMGWANGAKPYNEVVPEFEKETGVKLRKITQEEWNIFVKKQIIEPYFKITERNGVLARAYDREKELKPVTLEGIDFSGIDISQPFRDEAFEPVNARWDMGFEGIKDPVFIPSIFGHEYIRSDEKDGSTHPYHPTISLVKNVITFKNCSFYGASFNHLAVMNAVFDNCLFYKTSFINSYLQDYVLLGHTKYAKAFHYCDFRSSILTPPVHELPPWKSKRYSRRMFAGVDFNHSNMSGAFIKNAWDYGIVGISGFRNVIFDENTEFRKVMLGRVDFEGAQGLDKAKFTGAYFNIPLNQASKEWMQDEMYYVLGGETFIMAEAYNHPYGTANVESFYKAAYKDNPEKMKKMEEVKKGFMEQNQIFENFKMEWIKRYHLEDQIRRVSDGYIYLKDGYSALREQGRLRDVRTELLPVSSYYEEMPLFLWMNFTYDDDGKRGFLKKGEKGYYLLEDKRYTFNDCYPLYDIVLGKIVPVYPYYMKDNPEKYHLIKSWDEAEGKPYDVFLDRAKKGIYPWSTAPIDFSPDIDIYKKPEYEFITGGITGRLPSPFGMAQMWDEVAYALISYYCALGPQGKFQKDKSIRRRFVVPTYSRAFLDDDLIPGFGKPDKRDEKVKDKEKEN